MASNIRNELGPLSGLGRVVCHTFLSEGCCLGKLKFPLSISRLLLLRQESLLQYEWGICCVPCVITWLDNFRVRGAGNAFHYSLVIEWNGKIDKATGVKVLWIHYLLWTVELAGISFIHYFLILFSSFNYVRESLCQYLLHLWFLFRNDISDHFIALLSRKVGCLPRGSSLWSGAIIVVVDYVLDELSNYNVIWLFRLLWRLTLRPIIIPCISLMKRLLVREMFWFLC